MTHSDQHIPRPFLFAAISMACIGVASFAYAWRFYPITAWVPLALLLVATALSENFAFALPEYSISLSYPLTMAGLIYCGPLGAALLATLSATNYQEIRARRPWPAMAFNWGQLVSIAVFGGWLYDRLNGTFLQDLTNGLASANFPSVLVPMTAVAVTCAVLNIAVTAVGVSLLRGMSARELFGAIVGFVPTQVALAFVGYLIAQVLAIGPVALIFFIAPLVVARQLYLRYSELRDAYADTIRSLIGALEAKDPYTRGHSERVAEYSLALGRAVGLDPHAVERLEYAALLHDLGKLAVPGAVLTKPGKLEPAEFDRIRQHPSNGADMIARIPPLRDLAQTIGQHHEWVDGRGYPAGETGQAICLPAKVLAVADSYDAMTTTRAYRPALDREHAVAELLGGAGTQFDADIVRVFIESRIGLPPGPAREEVTAGGKAAVLSDGESA